MHRYTAATAALNFVPGRTGKVRMPSVVSIVVRYDSCVIDDIHNLWPRDAMIVYLPVGYITIRDKAPVVCREIVIEIKR